MIINSPVMRTNDDGMYRVRFYDYDGTLLKQQYVASGGGAIAPANPSHTGLTFQGWSKSLSNITRNTDIAASYTTTDGKTRAFISVNINTGYFATFYIYKSDTSTITIDWGDGSTSTSSASGAVTLGSHTYAEYGDYEVTLWISSGTGTYALGVDNKSFCGGTAQNQRDMVSKLWVGANVPAIRITGLSFLRHMEHIMLPATVVEFMTNICQGCPSLEAFLVTATSVTFSGSSHFNGDTVLSVCVLSDSMTAIPAYFLYNSGIKSIVLPASTATIYSYAFSNCCTLADVTFSGVESAIESSVFSGDSMLSGEYAFPNLTSLGTYAFNNCYGITRLDFTGSTFTGMLTYVANACRSLEEITFPSTLLSLDGYCCALTHLKVVTIPASVTSIAAYAFTNVFCDTEFILESTTPPTLAATNAFYLLPQTIFWVPDASVDTYKAATNWVSLANYIRPISERV